MAQLLISILLSVIFTVVMLAWAFRGRDPKHASLPLNDLLPVHHLEYAALSEHLARYEEILRQVQLERRDAATTYLDALHEDFLRVERLLNHAAKFLPDLRPRDEWGRFLTALRFRFELRFVRLSIRLGFMPSSHLRALTRQIANLGRMADRMLGQIASHRGLPGLQSDLNGS